MSWLTGWQYRKSHIINGSTAGAVTDYQVRITVHYGSGTDSGEHVYLNGKCRTDFGDIRFTADDGTTELSYWMEKKVDSDYAIFWVKVPSIPASPNSVTIYIYYGKSDALTTSNIKNTSWNNLGDDFNDNIRDVTLWDELKYGGGTVAEVNQRLEVTCPADKDVAGYVSVSPHTLNNVVLEIIAHKTQIQEVELFISLTKTTSGNPWDGANWYRVMLFRHVTEGHRFYAQKCVNNTKTTLYYGTSISTEEKISIRIEDNIIRFFEQDTERANESWSLSSRNCYIYLYGRGGGGFNGTDWIDNFWIRKYVSPEPSHGTWGSEETAIPEKNVIVTNEAVNPTGGFIGDSVTYTSIVKDEDGNPLPETFVADLLMYTGDGEGIVYINGTEIGTFSAGIIGTSGNVYLDGEIIGTFTNIPETGDVYIDGVDIGDFNLVSLVLESILIDDQQFIAGVYDDSTGELTLIFTVPDVTTGTKTIKLKWEEQTI